MRLTTRVRKLEAAVPKCEGWYSRIVDADEELTEVDWCRLCGQYHVIVVQEVIVQTREAAERVWARNASEGRS